MKTGALPKQLDLRGLAARGVHIEGTVSPEDLPRLADSGIAIVESGSAAFDFRRDEEARYVVAVSVEARVVMQCQRCLSDMEVPVKSASLMACVWSDEEAAALPATYEPLIVDDAADLSDIAEEEILLAIPVSPIHEAECKSAEQQAALEPTLRSRLRLRIQVSATAHLRCWSGLNPDIPGARIEYVLPIYKTTWIGIRVEWF